MRSIIEGGLIAGFAFALALGGGTARAATITFEDFEAGATGWSDNRSEDPGPNSGGFSRHLGRFGRAESSSKTFALSGTQTAVSIAFDLYRLDTWDSEIFTATISDGVNSQSVTETGLYYDGGPTNVYGPAWADRIAPLTLDFLTSATSITLTFSSNLDQDFLDESWGVDNLRITDDSVAGPAVPEPATWAMMLSGFGLIGGMTRRRSAMPRALA